MFPFIVHFFRLVLWWTSTLRRLRINSHLRYLENFFGAHPKHIHPGSLTWNLRIHPWNGKNIFQTIIFRFYVNLHFGMHCHLRWFLLFHFTKPFAPVWSSSVKECGVCSTRWQPSHARSIRIHKCITLDCTSTFTLTCVSPHLRITQAQYHKLSSLEAATITPPLESRLIIRRAGPAPPPMRFLASMGILMAGYITMDLLGFDGLPVSFNGLWPWFIYIYKSPLSPLRLWDPFQMAPIAYKWGSLSIY